MNSNFTPDPIPTFADRFTRGLKSFGARVLVHAASIGAAIALVVVGEPMAAKASGSILAAFSAYLGFICLLSPGLSRGLNGLFPFGLGLLQAGVIAMLGAPAHAALLAGGTQSFIQRAIVTKGSMGSGWIALPFMFISGIMLLSGYGISFESMPSALTAGAASFAGIGVAGWGLRAFLRRTIMKPFYIQKLQASLIRMETSLASHQLPAPMQQQLRVLVGETRQYLHTLPPFDEQVEHNILALETTANQVLALSARSEPNLWDKAAGLAHNAILRSSNSIRPWLTHQATQSMVMGTTGGGISALPESAQTQQQNADKLLGKKELLPDDLQPYIETIYRSAQNILDTVRDKPQNEHAAVQFLNRYLGASHRVADEIVGLMRSDSNAGEALQKQLIRSKELLARLETAFASEHAHLLQAEVINLTAELGVLDSLLKMDGH